jgi:alpha-galactosidase
MTKVVLIGAGSTQFGVDMLCDLYADRETLKGSTVSLVDVNAESLQTMSQVARRLNEASGEPFVIEAATDRCQVLDGAQFVIISVAVKRNELWRRDFQIPLKHGVKQVLGENGGPGGLSHALRTIPLVLDICRDIERLCPDALVLNLTNPEGRICLAASRYTDLRFVGLCHGIGMAQAAIGQVLGLPPDDIDPLAAGLNHFSWILELRRRSTGEDLYRAFRKTIAEQGVEEAGIGPYRFGVKLCRYLMDTFGYWPLPSDDHVGEYLSYAWEYCGLEGYDFEQADRQANEKADRLRRWATAIEAVDPLLGRRSGERAVPIITGVLGNTHQYELAVNVANQGRIPNLPGWAIVEIPALVSASGVSGIQVGSLPAPIASMCQAQAAIIDRVVEAAVRGDRTAALQALLLDPVVSSAYQAERILDAMLQVHKEYLPQFSG